MRRARPGNASAGAASADLGPVLGFMRALWELDHALAAASKRMKQRLGVTGPERLVARIVGQIPEISPGELAALMHVHPSSLTALLKRMVRRGLVQRRVSREDARRSHLRLTEKGKALDRVRGGTIEAKVQAALESLAPRDIATSVAVLGVLARNLGALASRPPRRDAGRLTRRRTSGTA